MLWSISFLFRCLDAVLGIMLAVLALGAVAGFFVMGGAPKKYEMDALGGACSSTLEAVEVAARQLRLDYCGNADAQARREARCPQYEA